MAKPLLTGGNGKANEFVGTANGQVATWSTADGGEWFPGSSGGSGGGGAIFYLNSATAAASPTGNVPGGSGGATAYFAPAQTSETFTATAQTRLAPPTGELPSDGSWAIVQGFLSTDALGLTSIPAGLWDFNLWAKASTGAGATQTQLRIKVGVYDGTNAPTILATSGDVYIYDPTVAAQYAISVVIGSNTISATDRLYIEIDARASANNRTATFYFGGANPSHVHTTIIVPVNLASDEVTGILPTTKGGSGVGTGSLPAINTVFAGAASGSADLPTFRALVAGDIPSLTTLYLPKAGGTMDAGSKLTVASSTATKAGFSLNPTLGLAPSSPQAGDIWTVSTGAVFISTAGVSQQFITSQPVTNITIQPTASTTARSFAINGGAASGTGAQGGAVTISAGTGGPTSGIGGTLLLTAGAGTGSGANGALNIGTSNTGSISVGAATVVTTFNGRVVTPSLTTSAAGFNITPTSATPTTLSNGDMWTTAANLFVRINGATQTLASIDAVNTAVAASSGAPYDVPFQFSGAPDVSSTVLYFKASRAWNLAATGHVGGAATAPTGTAVSFTVYKGVFGVGTPTSLGTITFNTDGSFSSSITATSFAVNEILSIYTAAANNGLVTPFATLLGTIG
jgi:hypothetical protein